MSRNERASAPQTNKVPQISPCVPRKPSCSLGMCENRDGWLVAWGLCGCMLIRFSAVWLLPFTLL